MRKKQTPTLVIIFLAFFPCSHAAMASSPSQALMRVKDVSIGYHYTCAVLSNNQVKCWGHNPYGNLGYGDIKSRGTSPAEMGDALPPVDLGVDEKVTFLDASSRFNTCVAFSSGKAKCWGKDAGVLARIPSVKDLGTEPGQMGTNLPLISFGDGEGIKAFSHGMEMRCALGTSGRLKCTDNFKSGTYSATKPFGFTSKVTQFMVEPMRTSYFMQCAIFEDGKGACWREGTYNVCGGKDQFLPEMQDAGGSPALAPNPVEVVGLDLGPGESVRKFVAGYGSRCALLGNGKVKCWGFAYTDDRNVPPTREGCKDLPAIDLGTETPVIDLVSGLNHSCALFQNGKVKCWGRNFNGSLGLGDTMARSPNDPATMGTSLPYVDLASLPVVKLAAGGNHTCAILSNGGLKCWGENTYGELGLGESGNRGDAPGDMGDGLPFVMLWDPLK